MDFKYYYNNIWYVYCTIHSVASSEKVDKWARYADFRIASMPYPGIILYYSLYYRAVYNYNNFNILFYV